MGFTETGVNEIIGGGEGLCYIMRVTKTFIFFISEKISQNKL